MEVAGVAGADEPQRGEERKEELCADDLSFTSVLRSYMNNILEPYFPAWTDTPK